MENKKYPKNFYKLFRVNKTSAKQSKEKSYKIPDNTKNKTCKKFCKNVFLPIREEIEMEYAKKNKITKYLGATKSVKKMYLQSCHDIYCQPKCKGINRKWLKSFTKKRKDKLIQQGAISGCRNLHKEFPEYYKNI